MYDGRGYIMHDGYGCDGMMMMIMLMLMMMIVMEVAMAMAMVSHDDV